MSHTRVEAAGAAVALFSFPGVTSAVIGPPLTGLIKDLTGPLTGSFYMAVAVALVGFALSLVPGDSGRSGTSR